VDHDLHNQVDHEVAVDVCPVAGAMDPDIKQLLVILLIVLIVVVVLQAVD